jgi:hypothetical protein
MLKTNLLFVGKVGETKKRIKGTVKSSGDGKTLRLSSPFCLVIVKNSELYRCGIEEKGFDFHILI